MKCCLLVKTAPSGDGTRKVGLVEAAYYDDHPSYTTIRDDWYRKLLPVEIDVADKTEGDAFVGDELDLNTLLTTGQIQQLVTERADRVALAREMHRQGAPTDAKNKLREMRTTSLRLRKAEITAAKVGRRVVIRGEP